MILRMLSISTGMHSTIRKTAVIFPWPVLRWIARVAIMRVVNSSYQLDIISGIRVR